MVLPGTLMNSVSGSRMGWRWHAAGGAALKTPCDLTSTAPAACGPKPQLLRDGQKF